MKVLIISHNPITTYQNMGKTLLSLFSSFRKDELCQLYIYPTLPDIDICNSYYKVTDRDVLKSYIKFRNVNSTILSSNDIDAGIHTIYESDDDADFFKKKKKNSLTLLCRDFMWKFAKWYDNKLEKWLDEEKPTCIFLAPGESKFIYDVAIRIAKKLNIDIFTYICDEYYFVKAQEGIVNRMQLFLLKRKMNIALRKSKGIITICDELAHAYHEEFDTETHTIFTGTNYKIASKPNVRKEVRGITFMGNISCNRFNPIAEVGKVIDELNKENGTDHNLFLYTSPLKEDVKQLFSKIDSIKYMGYVMGNEFKETLYNADILLHVEAFDRESIARVKNSISTKIADCLASGVLLFAYGPKEVASMKHLIRNDCAVVVNEHERLKKILDSVLNKSRYEQTIIRALSTAEEFHTSQKNSNKLYNILNVDDICN